MFILLVIYVISIFWLRYEMIHYYKHEFKYTKPEFGDVIVTVLPAINTIWAICFFLERKAPLRKLLEKLLGKHILEKITDKFFGMSGKNH